MPSIFHYTDARGLMGIIDTSCIYATDYRYLNDSMDDAKLLVKLLKGIPAKINLIPFNPWPGTKYECSDWEQIEKFSEYIFNAGYSSPVRTPRGRDILAACGQLKSETEKLSARERQALRAMAMTD